MENNSAQEDNSGNDPVTTSPTQSKILNFKIFPFKHQKTPSLFLLVFTGLLFYCTSLYNEYALDDGIIYTLKCLCFKRCKRNKRHSYKRCLS